MMKETIINIARYYGKTAEAVQEYIDAIEQNKSAIMVCQKCVIIDTQTYRRLESVYAITEELDCDLIILVIKCFLNETVLTGEEELKEIKKLQRLQKVVGGIKKTEEIKQKEILEEGNMTIVRFVEPVNITQGEELIIQRLGGSKYLVYKRRIK